MLSMLVNFLKTSFRNFQFNKIYTLINLSGLTLGFTVFILATLFVMNELSYDNFHKNGNRIYRILSDGANYRNFTKFPVVAAPMGPALKGEFPQIETYARLDGIRPVRIAYRNNYFFEDSYSYTDPAFFKMFSVDFIEGNPVTILNSPNSVVLSQSLAMKIFGTTKVLGEEIDLRTYKEMGPFVITGVYKDFPENSIFTMDIISQFEGTLKNLGSKDLESWNNNNYHTFIMLSANSRPGDLQAQMPFFRDKYTNDKLNQEGGQKEHYLLQPLRDCHYDTEVAFELKVTIPKTNLFLILLVTSLVLVLAAINYVNLTSAKSLTRAKEIGVRKTIGAQRRSLILQFLTESIIISLLAFSLAMLASMFLLPYFNNFLQKDLTFNIGFDLTLLAAALLFGILSGIYPAYILSGHRAIKVLKGRVTSSKQGSAFSNFLVGFQIIASAVLLVVTWVIHEQLVFIQSEDPGYNKEQVLILNWKDRKLRVYKDALKSEILRLPGVEEVSMASHTPNEITQRQTRTWMINGEEREVSFFTAFIDSDFIPLLDIKLVAGRNISPTETVSQKDYIINESAVKELGLENPVGMHVIQGNDTLFIIGVVKDFHYANFHEPIQPMRLCYGDFVSKVLIKFNSANLQDILPHLGQLARKFEPDYQFDYDFLDDLFMKSYAEENNMQAISNALTVIAMFISCLGLYGLIMFSTNQKFREIGIRKVFGANSLSLIFLLVNKLNWLILVSFLVAVPISYLLLENWLAGFAYHIEIPLFIYLLSLMILLLLVWITVGAQTMKAVRLNPADVIRHE